MATPLEKLLVEIKADTSKLTKSLDDTKKKLGKTEDSSKKLGNSLKALGGIIATLGFAKLMGDTISTIREFEDLEATLRAVTGSAESAATSFKLIRAFTATTTFQIQEVASAFIKLKQAGIVPTSDVLQDFGNLAAGMGRSIETLAQAAFNATTGEMEMLKQFGVVARLEGNKIKATFDGTTTELERTGEAITGFLRKIGREEFGDALELRARTLSGAISNLKDATSEFMVSIGEGGLREELAKLAIEIKDVLMNNRQLATNFGQVLTLAVRGLANTLKFLLENIELVTAALAFLAGSAAAGAIIRVAPTVISLFQKLTKVLKGTAAASIMLQGATGIGIFKVAAGLTLATGAIVTMNKALEDADEVAEEATDSLQDLDQELLSGMKQNVKTIDQVSESVKRLSEAVRNLPKGKFTIFDALNEMGSNSAEIQASLATRQGEIFDNMMKDLGTSSPNKTIMGAVGDMFVNGFFDSVKDSLDRGENLTNIQVAFNDNLKRALLRGGFKKEDVQGFIDKFNEKIVENIKDMPRTTVAMDIKNYFAEVMKQAAEFTQTEVDQFYKDLFGDKVTKQFFEDNIVPVLDVPGLESVFGAVDKLARENLMPKTISEMERVLGDEASFQGFLTFAKSLDQFIGLTDDQVKTALQEYIKNGKEAQKINPFAGLDGMEKFVADALNNAINGTDTLKQSFQELSETELDAMLVKLEKVLEELNIDATRASEILGNLQKDMSDSADTFSSELAVAVQQASTAFTADFVNSLEQAEDAMDAFESFAANIVKQIITIFLQLAIVNKILNQIFPGLNASTMDITGPDAFKVKNNTASGGRISGPRMVGERGPELFVPDATGIIKSNADTKGMMGGQSINVYQNINFATGVQSTVRAEVVKMLPQIAEVSKSAVAEQSGRSPSYRRTLLGG